MARRGRHPDLARRAREPRRGRRARLGDPGRRRRRRASRSATARSSSATRRSAPGDVITIDGGDRRGLRGRRRRRDRGRARGDDAPRVGRASSGSRSAAGDEAAARRCAVATTQRQPGDAGRLPPGDRHQGLRAGRQRSPTSLSPRPTTSSRSSTRWSRTAWSAPSAGALPPDRGGVASASPTLLADERAAWGVDAAGAALDAFLALDQRMKDIVTAWQMRDVDGAQVVNDHADADYDRAVLDRLAALHADAVAWLDAARDRRPRGSPATAQRLGRAAAQARGRRRPLRRLTARRQLPRHLVRAPRGPHPARRPHPRGRGRRRPRLRARSRLSGAGGPCPRPRATRRRPPAASRRTPAPPPPRRGRPRSPAARPAR